MPSAVLSSMLSQLFPANSSSFGFPRALLITSILVTIYISIPLPTMSTFRPASELYFWNSLFIVIVFIMI